MISTIINSVHRRKKQNNAKIQVLFAQFLGHTTQKMLPVAKYHIRIVFFGLH